MAQHIKKILGRDISQSGVTLLLSILVLSAIMAISFSLATIIFIEVRTSGDLVRTEGAIFGADAVSEQVLFKVKRKAAIIFPETINLKNNVKVDKPVESMFADPVFSDTVLTTSNTFLKGKVYYLFDPADRGGGSTFTKIRIENHGSGNGNNLKVFVCEFDPTITYDSPVCYDETSDDYWINTSHSVIKGGPTNPKFTYVYPPDQLPPGSEEWTLDKNKQQQVVIVNDTIAVIPIPIKIATYGPGGDSDPKAMPLVGEVLVPIKADNSGAVRRIELRIPNQ